ncbi:MAG: GLPGLI family protein [Weeksellaceae bacterium]|nr:GLPGLI family protein [Weeksellaceae bacterium]
MKKISLILLLISGLFNSQKTHRFFYEVNFKRDSLGTIPAKDIVVLEINHDSNLFLSNEYLVTDSANNTHQEYKDFADPKFTPIIEYKKSDDSFDFINVLSMNFFLFNSKRKINWTISTEKKKIGNFEVAKATAEYGGRHWIAWYSADIPFPYGPYVFYGLPGLILEISDDKDNFHFSFIQNKSYETELNSQHIIKDLIGSLSTKIREKDWKKVQLNYYENPLAEYKNGTAYITNESGEKFTPNDYRNYEKALQNQIKKFSNPIELSEKIHYK